MYLHNQGLIETLNQQIYLVSEVKVAVLDSVTIIKETITATSTLFKFKGMTLAYVAPEVCSQEVYKPSIKTDVYAWAISAFEVLSKFASPWENSLANLTDMLLLQAIARGKRPTPRIYWTFIQKVK